MMYLSFCNYIAFVVRQQNLFFKYGPIPASFSLFSSFSHQNSITNWKKHRWCAWDSNLGPQDGRRRQNHGAMAASPKLWIIFNGCSISGSSSTFGGGKDAATAANQDEDLYESIYEVIRHPSDSDFDKNPTDELQKQKKVNWSLHVCFREYEM